jgi:hypothetical protein
MMARLFMVYCLIGATSVIVRGLVSVPDSLAELLDWWGVMFQISMAWMAFLEIVPKHVTHRPSDLDDRIGNAVGGVIVSVLKGLAGGGASAEGAMLGGAMGASENWV